VKTGGFRAWKNVRRTFSTASWALTSIRPSDVPMQTASPRGQANDGWSYGSNIAAVPSRTITNGLPHSETCGSSSVGDSGDAKVSGTSAPASFPRHLVTGSTDAFSRIANLNCPTETETAAATAPQ